MTDIATNEPLELRVGDTWIWQRQDLSADFPATTWTLKYAFKNATQHFEIIAAASGVYFLVNVAMATTAGYVAGHYSWVAWVETATERHEVDDGFVDVLPTFNNATALDDRGHARRMLDAIEAVLERRATKDQEEYTIGQRTLKRMPIKDLLEFRDRYRGEVRIEEGLAGSKLVARL